MEHLCTIIPVVSEIILNKLDDQSVTNLKVASRDLNYFLDKEKCIPMRKIKKHTSTVELIVLISTLKRHCALSFALHGFVFDGITFLLDTIQDFLCKLGIETTYASSGNEQFFTKSCHCQTYQNY